MASIPENNEDTSSFFSKSIPNWNLDVVKGDECSPCGSRVAGLYLTSFDTRTTLNKDDGEAILEK